jgi:rhodanese-related sulfurtransferase
MTLTQSTAAEQHFAAKLQFETDPSDVAAALAAGDEFVLVDTRGALAWQQGRIAGAMHMPTASIRERAEAEIPAGTRVVTYCWGPGCNGSTRAALEFARLGYPVKEMIGGYEYWAREGLDVVGEHGRVVRATDPLTSPVDGFSCDC